MQCGAPSEVQPGVNEITTMLHRSHTPETCHSLCEMYSSNEGCGSMVADGERHRKPHRELEGHAHWCAVHLTNFTKVSLLPYYPVDGSAILMGTWFLALFPGYRSVVA